MDLISQFSSTELLENMRQKDDLNYSKLLSEIRVGNLNDEIIQELKSRVVVSEETGKRALTSPSAIAQHLLKLIEKDSSTLCLVPTVELMEAINKECLKQQGLEPVEIPSYDVTRGKVTKQSGSSGRKVRLILFLLF